MPFADVSILYNTALMGGCLSPMNALCVVVVSIPTRYCNWYRVCTAISFPPVAATGGRSSVVALAVRKGRKISG